MNTVNNHIIIQDKAAVSGSQNLRNGGFVFIKTIKSDGPNSYIVSLGNKFFKAYSEKPLALNSYLRVQVRLDGSKINLIAEQSQNNATDKVFDKLNLEMLKNGDFSSQIAERFNQLGLPLDLASFRLIAFFQQMGLKADISLLIKCRRIASKFSGYEEKASEIALFLAEKGINPSEENIAMFLNILLYGSNDFTLNQEFENETAGEKEDSSKDLCFFDKIYDVKISQIFNKPGLLTFSNHLTSNVNHWIIMPFLFSSGTELNDFRGNIRILIDLEKKITKKINISAESEQNKYNFTLYYNSNSISKILFYVDEPKFLGNKEKMCSVLKKMFPDIVIEYDENYYENGIFCDNSWNLKAVSVEV